MNGRELASSHSQIYGNNREEKEASWLSVLYLLWKEFHLWAMTWDLSASLCTLFNEPV